MIFTEKFPNFRRKKFILFYYISFSCYFIYFRFNLLKIGLEMWKRFFFSEISLNLFFKLGMLSLFASEIDKFEYL